MDDLLPESGKKNKRKIGLKPSVDMVSSIFNAINHNIRISICHLFEKYEYWSRVGYINYELFVFFS